MYMNSKIEDEYKYLHFIMIILHYTYLPQQTESEDSCFFLKKKNCGILCGILKIITKA